MMKPSKMMLSALVIVAGFIFTANAAEAALPFKQSVIDIDTLHADHHGKCDPSKDICIFIKADNSIPEPVAINMTTSVSFSDGKNHKDIDDLFISQHHFIAFIADPADLQHFGVTSFSFVVNTVDKQPVANCLYKAEDPSQFITGLHTLMISKLPGGYTCQVS